ncbi:hypothetical protein AB0H36_19475 [Kribbella sp. NPDC050820]|uniref:hypothetical protein n=1 Tax=Kribbella sp. NPDC050820 TaxID=3155408 RepID=UPI0033D494EF
MSVERKQTAHRALVDQILNGPGTTSADERARAFGNAVPSHPLIDKVATRPTQITDEDFAATGLTDDQLFELVIAAAVGQSARMYDAGLAALAEATGEAG